MQQVSVTLMQWTSMIPAQRVREAKMRKQQPIEPHRSPSGERETNAAAGQHHCFPAWLCERSMHQQASKKHVQLLGAANN
eukprot:1157413-Pelagomonas_calceolata.AAC.4